MGKIRVTVVQSLRHLLQVLNGKKIPVDMGDDCIDHLLISVLCIGMDGSPLDIAADTAVGQDNHLKDVAFQHILGILGQFIQLLQGILHGIFNPGKIRQDGIFQRMKGPFYSIQGGGLQIAGL